MIASSISSKEPPQAKDAASIYKAILKTQWLEEKKELGMELGRLGSQSEPFLLKLYEAESYWDRIAAISASTKYFSAAVNSRLVKSYLEDHMVETESESAIQSNLEKYIEQIRQNWDSDVKIESRKKMIKLLALSNDSQAIEFSKREIEDRGSKYRSIAFQTLCSKKEKKDDVYIRSKLAEKDIRQYALKYILETGQPSDKKIMLDVLSEIQIQNADFTFALGGIKKWGSFQEQEIEYTKALQNEKYDDSLKLYSIVLFREFRSEPIRVSLCEISKYARDQSARVTASEALVPFQNIKNIECLKRIVNEDFQSSNQGFGFGDAVAMFATLGISNVLRGIQENRSRASFLGRQNELKKHIQFLELKAKENN